MVPGAALEDPFGLLGTVLEGQYRTDAVVGEGGFGVVYRGWHLSLEQPVAIKVLKGLDGGDVAINGLVLEKFRAEARLLYTLSQSSLHIVRSLDFGAATMPNGVWAPFMILEWLEGRSLSDDLSERRRRGMHGRSVSEALAILEPVAEGLSVAHQHQVAHRDIKPANIFLLQQGDANPFAATAMPQSRGPLVKVLDFGIAKIMKEGEAAGTKGTFASFTWLYAAPEQLDPRVGTTGLATDVYAFVLMLTELLTDRPPVDDRNVIDILKAATNPHRRPTPRTRGANIPDALEAVCLRALSVDPKDRYPTIAELWAAISVARESRRDAGTAAVPPMSKTATAVVPSRSGSGSVNPPSPRTQTALPMSAPLSSVASQPLHPPPSQYAPSTLPSNSGARQTPAIAWADPGAAAMSPPPGTRPPQTLGVGAPPLAPYTGVSPPFGTPPPGQIPRRAPIVRADGTTPIVIITILFFVLAVLFAGTCAVVQAAC